MRRTKGKFIKIGLGIFLVLIAALRVEAQTTKIYGTIRDAETNEVIPYVIVTFKGTKIGTFSDDEGNYMLESYYASDSLSFSLVGYKRKTVAVKKDKVKQLNIALTPNGTDLKEVVVNAKDFETNCF